MRLRGIALAVALTVIWVTGASAAATITGRLFNPRTPGSDQMFPFTAIYTFAGQDGPMQEPVAFRTWELEPSSWYHMVADEGSYTVVYTNPAQFMRPLVRTNVYVSSGEKNDTVQYPRFDYACFYEGGWDGSAAREYYQTFTATGVGVTHVGFKPVHDGIDGGGPGGQPLLISLHHDTGGAPDTWPQVGPEALVPYMDGGGVKGYTYSAGWNSGEVPLTPGERYAVRLRPKDPDGVFQMWARTEGADSETDCYRVGVDGTAGWASMNLWMAVGVDGDGLVIPYNKRVHKDFPSTWDEEKQENVIKWVGTANKVSQTYVAQGRSLAFALIYAAVSGAQPSMNRQRLVVRVREGGPEGPVVGVEKIAIGNGNYTGDASWGTFAAVYSPGEVPLTPGQTYAIEFESIENYETLFGYVNIKGVESEVAPSFNAYQKADFDEYPHGTSYRDGVEMPFDVDMQFIEYAHAADNWGAALEAENLAANGDFEQGRLEPDNKGAARTDGWETFAIDPSTSFWYMTEPPEETNRMARVIGGGINNTTVDGGYVQRVDGLDPMADYVLTCDLRSSWRTGEKHALYIGYDRTGQTEDPRAETVVWSKALPPIQGLWRPYRSEPIAPVSNSISLWLRAWTSEPGGYPFKADFDNVALRKVDTGAPQGE